MIRFLVLGCVLILWIPTPAAAQLVDNAAMVTGNLAYASAESKELDRTLSGFAAGLSFERHLSDSGFLIGMGIAYLGTDENGLAIPASSEVLDANYSSWPITLGTRYFFMRGKWSIYLGLYGGAQFASLTVRQDGEPDQTLTSSDFVMSTPLGLAYFFHSGIYAHVNWTPYYVPDSDVVETWTNLFTLGVGYQLGD